MSQLKETADPVSPFGSADSGVRVPPLSSKAKRRHMSQLEETADLVSPFGSADSGVRVPSLPTKAKRSRTVTSPNSKSPPQSIESSFHSLVTIAKKASKSVLSRLDHPSRSADSRRSIPPLKFVLNVSYSQLSRKGKRSGSKDQSSTPPGPLQHRTKGRVSSPTGKWRSCGLQ